MKLSDSIFFEKWAHSRFVGKGDFRNDIYKLFVSLGLEKKAWQLTNRVRKYVSAYAHFFDVDDTAVAANEERYTIDKLLIALCYKFTYEEYKKSTEENIFHSERSAAFRRAVATLEPPIRRFLTEYTWGAKPPEDIHLTEYTWGAKPLEDIRQTWKKENFPKDFEPFWDALFREINENVKAAIKTEEEANAYFENNKGIKIERSTRTYINAVTALRAALRREGFRQ